MRRFPLWLVLLGVAPGVVLPVSAQLDATKPFDVWALQRIARVSEPQLSPDGSTLAFVVERVLLSDNRKEKHIYTVPLEGGAPSQLTYDGKSNRRPRWSPDSTHIAFVSDRSDSSQIWIMEADGSRPRQVTNLATEAGGVLFAPDGEHVLFTSRIVPECGDEWECNKRVLEEREQDPVKARTYDRLLYRRWDHWDDGRQGHLFLIDLEGGEPRDLTPRSHDIPPFSLGGPDAYDISPDGQEVCFAMAVGEDRATNTNLDLFVVSIEGGEPVSIVSGPAAETSPRYSPDGRSIAFRGQVRPGYESDRYRLMVYSRPTSEVANLTESFDRWVSEVAWSPDSSRLFFTAEDRGGGPIFTVPAGGGGLKSVVFGDAHHGDIQLTPDGRSIVYSVQSASHPTEVFRGFASGGPAVPLTRLNDDLMSEYAIDSPEEISYESIDGTTIHGFLVKPPGFDFERKYPLLLLIHGGPQGAWGQKWSYRWNPQVFAGAGYVVFMPNPRGSTGYGQTLTDAINGDWGGLVYEDIMAGLDYVLRRPYADSGKLTAAGASYGGYMINWMLGRTDRFRAFVSHAGVYDLPSMFGSTEELWFPIWEFNGTPWENPEMYQRWSPSQFANRFKTPTLVIHGEKDYRVPVTQAMQLFTALQLRKVPSKFLHFPDEGHWILKPRNSVHWYQSVIAWLDEWIARPHRPVEPPVYRRDMEREETPPADGGPTAATDRGNDVGAARGARP